MADHDNRRIPMLAAMIQTRSYQLTAKTRSLIFGTHRHRRETRYAHPGRRLYGNRREQNMADDAIADRGDKRYGIRRASQPVDEPRFSRRAEGLFVRVPNA